MIPDDDPANYKVVRPGDANRRIRERKKQQKQWTLWRRIYGGIGMAVTVLLLFNIQALGFLTGIFVVMILGACSLALLMPEAWGEMLKAGR